MRPVNRRHFLLTSAAAATFSRGLLAQSSGAPVTVTLREGATGSAVPTNFIGLSYESQQLSDPDFFAPANSGLIAQFRALAPSGVLRIGGNTSDVGWWKPTPASTRPSLPPDVVVVPLRPEEQPFQKLAYAITPRAILNLRAFLDATGWTCLYGINLGTSTPARAAEEAAFVAHTLGPKLDYFQLGNEPDLFPSRFRDSRTWTADTYFDEWLAAALAIEARVPSARFGLPDTSGNPQWYARVVDRLLALRARTCPCDIDVHAACSCSVALDAPPLRPRVVALSHHYYFGGPPSSPEVNIEALLRHNDRVDTLAHDIHAAAARLSLPELNAPPQPMPYRMSEGNTCYRGGKPGVSDVFAATLWAADYALTLAQYGYAGLNLHGGSGKAVADSLGGTLPGELLMPDPSAPHPRPFYTPIAEIGGRYLAEPVYFGLQFARHFAGATMLAVDFQPGTVNATAYASRLPTGETLIAIINKDARQPLKLALPTAGPKQTGLSRGVRGLARESDFRAELVLRASSLLSKDVRLELAGPEFVDRTTLLATIPPATAVLFRRGNR